MIYFFRYDNITLLYDRWLAELPDSRRDVVLAHKHAASRIQSLCAFRPLCHALGFVPAAFSHGKHGKPSIDRHSFNMSHTRGAVAVIVGNGTVGVDIECIRKHPERVCKRVFTDAENHFIRQSANPDAAFFKLWTLKESYIKALGSGFSFPPINVEFNFDSGIICSDSNFSFETHTVDAFQISACASHPKDLGIIEIFQEQLG